MDKTIGLNSRTLNYVSSDPPYDDQDSFYFRSQVDHKWGQAYDEIDEWKEFAKFLYVSPARRQIPEKYSKLLTKLKGE